MFYAVQKIQNPALFHVTSQSGQRKTRFVRGPHVGGQSAVQSAAHGIHPLQHCPQWIVQFMRHTCGHAAQREHFFALHHQVFHTVTHRNIVQPHNRTPCLRHGVDMQVPHDGCALRQSHPFAQARVGFAVLHDAVQQSSIYGQLLKRLRKVTAGHFALGQAGKPFRRRIPQDDVPPRAYPHNGRRQRPHEGLQAVAAAGQLQPLVSVLAQPLMTAQSGKHGSLEPLRRQSAFVTVIIYVVIHHDALFRRLSRMPGAEHYSGLRKGRKITDAAHKLQSGVIGLHHHIKKNQSIGVPAELLFRTGRTAGMIKPYAAPVKHQMLQHHAGHRMDSLVVIHHKDIPCTAGGLPRCLMCVIGGKKDDFIL